MPGLRKRVGWIAVAVAGVVGMALAGPQVVTPQAPPTGTPKKTDPQQLNNEVAQRIPQIVAAIAAPRGSTVVAFGLTTPAFLESQLQALGPEGRIVAVFRSYDNYDEARLSQRRYGGRVEPIFAADGDAHLAPAFAARVVLLDVEGFFLQEEDLYRQAKEGLLPDGRLCVLRVPREAPRAPQAGGKGKAPAPPPHGFAARLEANRESILLESAGFRQVEAPSFLIHRTFRIFARAEGS